MPWHPEIEPSVRAAVAESLMDLAHDLGRYMALQTQQLDPEVSSSELLDSLRVDLLATRRSAVGDVDAAAVWRPLRQRLGSILDHPRYRDTFLQMDSIAAQVEVLRVGRMSPAEARVLASEIRSVAAEFRKMGREAREAMRG